MVGNSWFKKNALNKCTWLRMAEGRVVDRALMDYVLLPKRMLGRLVDVTVWRVEGGGMCDRFFGGSPLLKLVGGWTSAWRIKDVRNVLNVSGLNNSVKERAFQESLRVK